MKKLVRLAAFLAAAASALCACTSYRSSGQNAKQDVYTETSSINSYDLEILDGKIEYTIDISTPEGAFKLRNLKTRREAEEYVLREAIMVNNCATIFNPQFNVLQRGRRILRVTVYGQPAVYKNQQKPDNDVRVYQKVNVF